MPRTIGFFIFPDFQLLDLTGPLAAFQLAGLVVSPAPYRWQILSLRGGPVRSTAGLEIATVAAGYRKGPATDSPLGLPFDADAAVAPELVHRYVTGDRATVLDLHVHRPTVRDVIDMNLEQLGLNDVGEEARATLTSLSLGSWDPQADEVAKRNAMLDWLGGGRLVPAACLV